jgi:hypothetical protein
MLDASAAVHAALDVAPLPVLCQCNELPLHDTPPRAHQADITCLVGAGITNGATSSTYTRADAGTRGQMAPFFVRFMQLLVDAGKLTPLP